MDVEALLNSTLLYAPPVILAAMGGTLSERSGVVNIALEGMMRVGAFFAVLGAHLSGNPWIGLASGAAAGMALATVHAYLCVTWKADQIVSGLALNLLALGGVTFLLEFLFETVGTSPAVPAFPGIYRDYTIFTLLAIALPVVLHGLFYFTVPGLRLRAVGEVPRAAETLGVSVGGVRYAAVLGSGLLAGIGGVALSLGTQNRFDNNMPAGLGFMALAAVVFGKWTPLGVLSASLFFSVADALAISLQTTHQQIPKGFFLAMPYVVTLLVLAGLVGKATPPAASGQPYEREQR